MKKKLFACLSGLILLPATASFASTESFEQAPSSQIYSIGSNQSHPISGTPNLAITDLSLSQLAEWDSIQSSAPLDLQLFIRTAPENYHRCDIDVDNCNACNTPDQEDEDNGCFVAGEDDKSCFCNDDMFGLIAGGGTGGGGGGGGSGGFLAGGLFGASGEAGIGGGIGAGSGTSSSSTSSGSSSSLPVPEPATWFVMGSLLVISLSAQYLSRRKSKQPIDPEK